MLQYSLSLKGCTFSLHSSFCLNEIRQLKCSHFLSPFLLGKKKPNNPTINQNHSAIIILLLEHRIQSLIASSYAAGLLPHLVKGQCYSVFLFILFSHCMLHLLQSLQTLLRIQNPSPLYGIPSCSCFSPQVPSK